MRDLAGEGRLRRFGSEYPIDIPTDDLRLIASRLDGGEWNDVSVALSTVANLERLVRRRLERVGPGRLPPQIYEDVAIDLEELCRAQTAVKELAQVEGVACPTADSPFR